MFIFEKVGHSKFVEMHGDTSDFFRSASKSDRYFFFINCDLFIELLLTDLCLHVYVNTSAVRK